MTNEGVPVLERRSDTEEVVVHEPYNSDAQVDLVLSGARPAPLCPPQSSRSPSARSRLYRFRMPKWTQARTRHRRTNNVPKPYYDNLLLQIKPFTPMKVSICPTAASCSQTRGKPG